MKYLAVILACLLIMTGCSTAGNGGSQVSEDVYGTEKVEVSSGDGIVTKAVFDLIQIGMSYEIVVEIVGGEGELKSESGKAGEDDYQALYAFNGKGAEGANAIFMFQGDKLVNKGQTGLE